MKKTALFAAVSALALAVPAVASAAPTEVSRYVADGDAASFQSFNADGSSTYLWVSRGGTQQSQETYLGFYSGSCSYTDTSYSCSGINGWGLIPNGDFAVHGQSGNADLVTDISAINAFSYSYSCDWNTWTCTFEEGPAPGGLISLSWSKTSEYRFTSNGRSEYDYLNFRYTNQGQSTSNSATVEGDVLGQPVFGAQGGVGASRSVTMSVYRNH